MDFDEIKSQAENLAREHPTEVKQGLDEAAGLLEGQVGHGEQIDEATQKIGGFLSTN